MKLGTIIRNCRHGRASYIYVKSDDPDTDYVHGPCINCVSTIRVSPVRGQVYCPQLCNLCNPHDGQRGHFQVYSTGRLSRQKIVYKLKEQ